MTFCGFKLFGSEVFEIHSNVFFFAWFVYHDEARAVMKSTTLLANVESPTETYAFCNYVYQHSGMVVARTK